MRRAILPKVLIAGLIGVFLLQFSGWAFAAELDDIKNAIHNKGAKWVAAETSVSRLPDNERKIRAGGHMPQLKETDTFISAEAPLAGIPLGIDWRNYNGGNYVTPVRDQGSCASCWAFATTAALESFVLIQEQVPGINEDLCEQVLLSCSGAGNCETGGYPDQASNYIRNTGLPPDMDYYYTATDGNCANAVSGWQQAAYRIGSWSYVCTSPSASAIKNALVTYGPLETMFKIYSDFYSYTSGIYTYTTGTYQGNHCVLIVGYDDATQCFIAKNSWGTGWGESGFFRIAYSECTDVVSFGMYTIAYSGGATCSYAISPTSQSFPDTGGAASINVSCGATCNWNAASSASWITVTQVTASQSNGTVYYNVAQNPYAGTVRKGTITVAGQSFAVSQGTATPKPKPGRGRK